MAKQTEAAEHELTGVNTHVATHRGYAHGHIVEPGEYVPHGIAVADEWMVAANAEAPATE